MKKVILKVEGMTCSACSAGLEKYLMRQKEIREVSVNLVLQTASITYEDSCSIKELETFISNAGFESKGVFDIKKNKKEKNEKASIIFFTALAILLMYIKMGPDMNLPTLKVLENPTVYTSTLLILTLPFLIYGLPIFKSGIKNILHKTPNMDTLVTLGVFVSFFYSIYNFVRIINGEVNNIENLYFESSAIIVYFVKLGKIIEGKNKEKTTESIKELVKMTPEKALLKTKDGEKKITIDEIKKGDILLAKPGMKIACDGEIIKGTSHIEEAFLTGESIPVKKKEKDHVLAGSINMDGFIEYKAIKIGADSTISEIVKLVVEATNEKAPIERIADKVSSYFVPTIMAIAFLTGIITFLLGNGLNTSILRFVTVLIIACPCSLGLATPLAIVVSTGLCAKNGILIKKSSILEMASKIDTIVFDKTGTLTYGNLKIAKILNYSNYEEKELLEIAASIEVLSTHPIATAFIKKKNNKLKVENFKNIAGIGVYGEIEDKKIYLGNGKLFSLLKIKNPYEKEEKALSSFGNSIVYMIENKKVSALFGIKDIIREEATITIKNLKKLKKEILMLTGDNETTAHIVAMSLGIEKEIANVLPNEKTKEIKHLLKKDKKVMMVGDGINDAPSLATAMVGVSMGLGTDVAGDASDVILIKDDLTKIPLLLEISKKTVKIIKQNLFWAFFYNLCMIPIAMGLFLPLHISMNPMLASFAMMMSSLTVVLNALRLRKK